MADLIPAFPDGAFRRVLCVVAHPDDVEYGMSSAVAAWTARGIEVAYLLLTRGEAGMDASPPDQTAELRTAEQIAGSARSGSPTSSSSATRTACWSTAWPCGATSPGSSAAASRTRW